MNLTTHRSYPSARRVLNRMRKNYLSSQEVVSLFMETSKALRKRREEIRKLDAACGDGDLGRTINNGLQAVEEVLQNVEEETDIGQMLRKAGMEFNNNAASTFGVFFATACMEAGKVVKGETKIKLSDIEDMFKAAVEGIEERGDAEVGDKTILDALVPAYEAIERSISDDQSLTTAFENAAQVAKEGAENTKGMEPKTGRAKQLGDRAIEAKDPGAMVVYFFLKELVNHLK